MLSNIHFSSQIESLKGTAKYIYYCGFFNKQWVIQLLHAC